MLRSNALSTGQNALRGAGRHRARLRRRRRARGADRHQHDRAVGAAAVRRAVRRARAGGDLVRRRPGGVHASRCWCCSTCWCRSAGSSGSCGSRTSRSAAPSASRSACCSGRAARPTTRPGARPRVRRQQRLPGGGGRLRGRLLSTRRRQAPTPPRALGAAGGRVGAPARRHLPRLPRRARRQDASRWPRSRRSSPASPACGSRPTRCSTSGTATATCRRATAIVPPRGASCSRRAEHLTAWYDRFAASLARCRRRARAAAGRRRSPTAGWSRRSPADLQRRRRPRHRHRRARDLDRRPPRRGPAPAGRAGGAGADAVA